MKKDKLITVSIGVALGVLLIGAMLFIINPWGIESAYLIGVGIGILIVVISEESGQ